MPCMFFLLWLLFLKIAGSRIGRRYIPVVGTECHACGYDMAGHDRDDACPECGVERAAAFRTVRELQWDPERTWPIIFAAALGIITVITAPMIAGPLLQLSYDLCFGPGRAIGHRQRADITGIVIAAVVLPVLARGPRPWGEIAMVGLVLVAFAATIGWYLLPCL